jgi:hypothetical protein
MPVVLFQQTTDKYGDTEIDANEQLRSVSFAVSAPYSALYQIAKAVQGGKPIWDLSEIPAQPGQGGFADKIFGIRFKSFDPAHPTTILCKAFYEDDPVPTGDLSSTSSFNTGGQVSPGGASVQVQHGGVLVGTEPILDLEDSGGAIVWSAVDEPSNTRIHISLPRIMSLNVSGAGAVISESGGFTAVNRLGVGRYQIGWTPFPLVPAISVICANAVTGNEDVTASGISVSGAQININDAGAAVDRNFSLLVIPTTS